MFESMYTNLHGSFLQVFGQAKLSHSFSLCHRFHKGEERGAYRFLFAGLYHLTEPVTAHGVTLLEFPEEEVNNRDFLQDVFIWHTVP